MNPHGSMMPLTESRQSHALFAARYGLSIAAVALGFAVRRLVSPWVGTYFPYLLFYPAIMLAARFGGFGPGAVSTLLSASLAAFFYMAPGHSFYITTPADRVSVPIFIAFGLLISWSSESLRRAEQRQRELATLATERARAEHEIAERLAATRDELLVERLRVNEVVRDVPGVVWQAWGDPGSPAGQRLDFVSGYAFRLLGYQPEEWIAQPNFWLSIVHPDDRDRAMREAHELYQAGFGGVIEFRWIGRDGREVWVASHVRTIQESGTSVGMRGVAFDITARKQLEVERAELLAQARASNRAKDDFLATVSHELRTPINAVLGWTQMLRAGILPPERAERALDAIDRNGTALSRMIEDLLDVSRIASGKFRLEFEDVQLETIVRFAVDVVRPSAVAKGVRVESWLVEPGPGATAVTPGAGALALKADPQRLEQALWNLLSNAIKFTPAGGRVWVDVASEPDHLTLVVADTGEGIAPDILPHIFERFRQGDASTTRSHAGLGIGLALVRHIVELHGGSVRAASNGRGEGTTFHVRLPRRPPPLTESDEPQRLDTARLAGS